MHLFRNSQSALFLLLAVAALFLSVSGVLAQNQTEPEIFPQLVSDINTNTPSSNPSDLVVMNGMMYFSAIDGIHGDALWKSDGTAAGTQLVKELHTEIIDYSVRWILATDDRLLIHYRDNLWISDGTEAGTKQVDIDGLDYQDFGRDFLIVESTLYFVLPKPGVVELWAIDSSQIGARQLLSLPAYGGDTEGIRYNIKLDEGDHLNGKPYFFVTGYDPAAEAITSSVIWESDGTEAGTKPVITVDAALNVQKITAGNNAFYFTSADLDANTVNIWKSNGTQSGTTLAAQIQPELTLSGTSWEEIVWNETLYFSLRQSSEEKGEFWKSDGTATGTIKISDKCAQNLFPLNDSLFFSDGTCRSSATTTLWKTDGTEVGTIQIKIVDSVLDMAEFKPFIELNGYLFFRARTIEDSYGIWRSDGTAEGTVLVQEIGSSVDQVNIDDDNLQRIEPHINTDTKIFNDTAATLGNKLYFTGYAPLIGQELYVSDGTTEGTELVKDIYSRHTYSSFPGGITEHGSDICFFSKDLYFEGFYYPAYKLYCVNEDLEQVRLVVERGEDETDPPYWPSDSIESLIPADNILYFTIDYDQLWRTDGTVGGTYEIDYDPALHNPNIGSRVTFDDSLIFFAGNRVQATDGTVATQLMDDYFYKVHSFAEFNRKIIFSGRIGGDILAAEGLWITDGTTDSTVLIYLERDFSPTQFQKIIPSNEFVYLLPSDDFVENDGIWKSDGTQEGTFKFTDVTALTSSGVVLAPDNTIYFTRFDTEHGTELWKSDGTSEGTILIADVVSGPESAKPQMLNMVGNEVYFIIDSQDQTFAWELWKSDGTEDGTVLVKQFADGYTHPSNPANSQVGVRSEAWGNYLVMMLQRPSGEVDRYSDDIFQSELWISSGTLDTTQQLMAASPVTCTTGHANLPEPCTLMKHDALNQIFFRAFDEQHGFELWTLTDELTATPTPVPTDTPVPPTETPIPPTPTQVLPTDTPMSTATQVLPTDTPIPTDTPVTTDTPIPPTNTTVPTDMPTPTVVPTDTSVPTNTPVAIESSTPTATLVSTDTPLPTAIPTETAVPTAVPTDTQMATTVPTEAPTASPTSTSVPQVLQKPSTTVVINEIAYAPDGNQSMAGTQSQDTGWIELLNIGDLSVDISTWWLTSMNIAEQLDEMEVIAGSLILEPNQYVVVAPKQLILNRSESDLGLYWNEQIMTADAMMAYLQWGSDRNMGQANIAVEAELWSQTTTESFAYVDTAPPAQSLIRLNTLESEIQSYTSGMATPGTQNPRFTYLPFME